MKWISLSLVLFITGCSTVDRLVYYSPESDRGNISGPKRPESGWLNFGGDPDTYSDHGIEIKTDDDTQPYLWGPWFASILPIFPVTWAVKAFTDDSLEILLESSIIDFKNTLNKNEFYHVQYVVPPNTTLAAQASKVSAFGSISEYPNRSYLRATFPLGNKQLDSFIFVINSKDEFGNNIEVKFDKNSRWRWKQWPIN